MHPRVRHANQNPSKTRTQMTRVTNSLVNESLGDDFERIRGISASKVCSHDVGTTIFDKCDVFRRQAALLWCLWTTALNSLTLTSLNSFNCFSSIERNKMLESVKKVVQKDLVVKRLLVKNRKLKVSENPHSKVCSRKNSKKQGVVYRWPNSTWSDYERNEMFSEIIE